MKNTIAGTAAIALTLGSLSAQALTVFPDTKNTFEDQNQEFQHIDANGNGLLDVGDSLRGVLTMTEMNSDTGVFPAIPLGALSGNQELTAIFEAAVTSKTFQFNVPTLGIDFYDFEFGPAPGFEATYGVGAIVAMFTDTAANADLILGAGSTACSDQATCEAAATNGTPFLVAGIVGPGNRWFADNSPEAPAASAAFPGDQNLGSFRFALDLVSNNVGYPLAVQSILMQDFATATGQVVGSGQVLGGLGLPEPYVARSDFDYAITPVPVPAPMALVGVGLLGMGLARRRRAS